MSGFTYMHGGGGGSRWITHDPGKHFAGEFSSESEAKAACERWAKYRGDLIVNEFRGGGDDHDRGVHTLRLKGTSLKWSSGSNWGNTSEAGRVAAEMRNWLADLLEAAEKSEAEK